MAGPGVKRSSSSIRNSRRKSVEYYPSPISSVASLEQTDLSDIALLRTPESRLASSYSPSSYSIDLGLPRQPALPSVPASPTTVELKSALFAPVHKNPPEANDGNDIPAAMAAFDDLVDSTIKALHEQTLALRSSLTQLLPPYNKHYSLRPKPHRQLQTTSIDEAWQRSAFERLESLIVSHQKVDAVNTAYHAEMDGTDHWFTEYDFEEVPMPTVEVELDRNGFAVEHGVSQGPSDLIIGSLSAFGTDGKVRL